MRMLKYYFSIFFYLYNNSLNPGGTHTISLKLSAEWWFTYILKWPEDKTYMHLKQILRPARPK